RSPVAEEPTNKTPPDKRTEERKPPLSVRPQTPAGDALRALASGSVLQGASDDLIRSALASYATLKLPDLTAFQTFKMPSFPTMIDTELLSKYRRFEGEVVELRKRIDDQAKALGEAKTSGKEKERKIAELEAALDDLGRKEQLGYLLSRVNHSGQRHLLASSEFRKQFFESTESVAFVLSV